MKPFNELTRGQQYLRLLRQEYEDIINAARFRNDTLRRLLRDYSLEPEEIEQANREISLNEKDIEFFGQSLGKFGGVENEESILTESQNSESPTDRFVGINCTTVI